MNTTVRCSTYWLQQVSISYFDDVLFYIDLVIFQRTSIDYFSAWLYRIQQWKPKSYVVINPYVHVYKLRHVRMRRYSEVVENYILKKIQKPWTMLYINSKGCVNLHYKLLAIEVSDMDKYICYVLRMHYYDSWYRTLSYKWPCDAAGAFTFKTKHMTKETLLQKLNLRYAFYDLHVYGAVPGSWSFFFFKSSSIRMWPRVRCDTTYSSCKTILFTLFHFSTRTPYSIRTVTTM